MLSKKINNDSLLLLVFAHRYSTVWLQKDFIDFIAEDKSYFFKREEFRNFTRSFHDLFYEIAMK